MVIQWHNIFTINTTISAQLKITTKLSFWTVNYVLQGTKISKVMPIWMHAHEVQRKHFQLPSMEYQAFSSSTWDSPYVSSLNKGSLKSFLSSINGVYLSVCFLGTLLVMDLTWGSRKSRVEKNLSRSLGLFIRDAFLLIFFCCWVNILLYFINKILVIFKHSVIYCVHL